jgi:hypothetical protein
MEDCSATRHTPSYEEVFGIRLQNGYAEVDDKPNRGDRMKSQPQHKE